MLGLKIIQQNQQGLVETLGKYSKTVNSGLQFYIPLIQKIRKVSLAVHPVELSQYSVITKDNADVYISLTLTYHVTDAYKFSYNNTDSVEAMYQLVRGHLRDIIGKQELNETLGSTSSINKQLFDNISPLTTSYGLNVDRVNIDELHPDKEVQASMNRQLKADREKVAAIKQAEGNAQSITINNKAENEAQIASSKAAAESAKAEADGKAYATEKASDADLYARKQKAEAEAYSIAKAAEVLEHVPNNYFISQNIKAYAELAKSNNNMVVTSNPSDITTSGALFGKGFNQKDK